MLVVADGEAAGGSVELQLQLAALQHRTVNVAERGHEHAVAHRAAVRTPVYVEVMRGAGRRAVFQDVEPPGIVVAHDAEVDGARPWIRSEPRLAEHRRLGAGAGGERVAAAGHLQRASGVDEVAGRGLASASGRERGHRGKQRSPAHGPMEPRLGASCVAS